MAGHEALAARPGREAPHAARAVAAIARGEQVDPARYYFRATPSFETGAAKYAWLNRIICVCSGVRTKEEVLLDFYEVK